MTAPDDVRTFRVEVGGGRMLEVRAAGPADGIPLIAHHGTPSIGLPFGPYVATAASRGLQLVTATRPGYAGSTRDPGRTVASCAADTAAVADAVGAERFYVTGQSGGGPHALACAALLPDRVISAACIGTPAPYGAEGLDWLDGMGEGNIVEF
ncbi:MAG TPA: alpha/beta hydrolase, partial [Actinomycetota bacterium]|nr:alpha/beta hydrolase [Actinomycetota bacterium]